MKPVIEIKNLTCQFSSTRAVNGIDLKINKGSICALLGPNGAGKSTTIKSLMGLQPQYTGEIEVLGVSSKALTKNELQRIGYVSEDQKLPGWMTTKQLMNYCRPLYPTWDQEFNDALIKQFNLPRERKISQFSRGMKMKAALIASISYRPSILILDEPFSGLDPAIREEVIDGILALTEQEQWTVLLTSHDLEEVERLADHITIMKSGNLVLDAQISILQQNFSAVEVTLKKSPDDKVFFPNNWLQTKINDHYLEFIHQSSEEVDIETEITNNFGEITSITSETMSLRDIYLAVTRNSK